jgi:AbiJ N-terminal domain 5
MIPKSENKEFLRLKDIAVAKFTEENWLELGMLTDALELVQGHGRLLRSLQWNDSDYSGNAMSVLMAMVSRDPQNFNHIKEYVDERYSDDETFVSSKLAKRRITFAPNVFEIPEVAVNDKLVSVMMPFALEFKPTYEAIKRACEVAGFECKRADDIWENSILIQDIFRLIFTSRVVISDFSGRNPNVMYETGIAHTLGKTVIPITRDGKDIPFDLIHHRYLTYLPNGEGLAALRESLKGKLMFLGVQAVAL